jgi:hypothetical protein
MTDVGPGMAGAFIYFGILCGLVLFVGWVTGWDREADDD